MGSPCLQRWERPGWWFLGTDRLQGEAQELWGRGRDGFRVAVPAQPGIRVGALCSWGLLPGGESGRERAVLGLVLAELGKLCVSSSAQGLGGPALSGTGTVHQFGRWFDQICQRESCASDHSGPQLGSAQWKQEWHPPRWGGNSSRLIGRWELPDVVYSSTAAMHSYEGVSAAQRKVQTQSLHGRFQNQQS